MKREGAALFADVRGSPGAGARLRGLLRMLWPLAPALVAAGYLLRAAWPRPGISMSAAGFGLMVLAGASCAFLILSRRRLAHYLKGAAGEEMVARELGRLPASHVVLHGLPAGRGAADIDHVVIGPAGVFVVETKNWSGAIAFEHGRMVYEGWSPAVSPIAQVKAAASALRDRLQQSAHLAISVQSVLVFASSSMTAVCQGVDGVRVCGLDRLLDMLTEPGGEPLTDGLRRQIVEALGSGLQAA